MKKNGQTTLQETARHKVACANLQFGHGERGFRGQMCIGGGLNAVNFVPGTKTN
jgi:hypothetical protein